jgi:plasmid maintenance system antidote protein VapI
MKSLKLESLFIEHEDITEEIENEIRKRIKEIGNNKAADMLGTHKGLVSEFVNGKRKLSIKMLKKISEKIY